MIDDVNSDLEFAKRSSKDLAALSLGALVGSVVGIAAESAGLGLEAFGAFAPPGGAIFGGAVGVVISELRTRKSRKAAAKGS